MRGNLLHRRDFDSGSAIRRGPREDLTESAERVDIPFVAHVRPLSGATSGGRLASKLGRLLAALDHGHICAKRKSMGDDFDGILNREQIRTLISVAERGSFYGAATQLGVKQPAVNQLVKRLEDKLGRRLFDRSPSGTILTHDGEAVLVYARTMAQLGADLSRRFRTGAPATALRVGIGEEFSRTSLPIVLALFDKLHADVSLRVTSVIPSETLFKELDEGRLDVVVARQDPDRRSGELICSEPTVWVGWEGWTGPIGDPVPLVLPALGVVRTAVLTALAAASREWRIVFEGTDLTSIGAALKAGLGVCACSARIAFPDVVRLSDAGLPDLAPSVYVLERASSPRSEAHDAFCDVLREAAHLTYLGVAQAPNAD